MPEKVDIKSKSLFARLKRLFSADVIVRNVGGKQLKIKDTDSIMYATDRNTLRDRFNRVRTSGYSQYSRDFTLAYAQSRMELFRDYDTMDMDPILSSALDIYADESLVKNEMGDLLTISSPDHNIKQILNNLFYDILNIESNLWSWTRNLCKYGDFYLKLYISPEYGVYMVEPLSAYNVQRIENSDPSNKNYTKFQMTFEGGIMEELENYQMIHFRLLSDSNFLPYGKCIKYDSYIDTEFGAKQIKDINVGDKIWSFNKKSGNFELTKVQNVINSGEKELLRIRTQHNFIDSSKNHPILTLNIDTKDLEYKLADEIKIGDLLIINSNKNKLNRNITINKIISEDITCASFIPDVDCIPDIVDEEFSNFFGFMLGDGWIKKYTTGWRICFSLGIDETQNNYYISLLKKYSGKSPYISKVGCKNGKSRTATVYSKRLGEIFTNMGFSGSARTKRIPLWVFELEESLRLSFLEGFHNADGWNFADEWANHYCIDLCNKDLIHDLKKLIQFSNIKSSIPSSKIYNDVIEICNHKCNRTESHLIYYYLDGDSKQQLKKYNFINSENVFLEPVRKIEDIGTDTTYDIQVESENSNFIANGIVVHNSMIEGGRRVWKQVCLHENSEVWTNNGTKKIKDIAIGDNVWNFNTIDKKLELAVVKNTACSGIQDIYEIKTAHRTIYATAEHPILTNDNSYKLVKELSLNDYVILPNINNNSEIIPDFILKETNDWSFDSKLIRINPASLIENINEFCRFFGFMLGDGWLDKSNKTVCFSIGNRIDKSNKHLEFVKKLGLSYRITKEGTTKANCIIHSVYFYKLLEQLEFRTGTLNKILPSWVWNLKKENRASIVFGFGDADGADLELDNAYQVGSINNNLIYDLRILAMQSGLSVTKIWNTKNASKTIMSLFVFRNKSRDFKKITDDYNIEKIRSITKSDKANTYDIEVNSKFSNFIADGIVVHNCLMEDAMLIHRIMRAPDKRIFKLDIAGIPPQEVDNFMEKTINKMKKVPYIDEKTGEYNLKFNMQNMVEDFFLPVRGNDSGTSIEPLSGMEFTGIDDIEYLRNKMMAALKIPKAFLGYEEGLSGKSTLASEDVRFSKTITRIQKMIVVELTKIAIVHLYAQGYRDESMVDFNLELTNPSTIFEKEKVSIWTDKMSVAKDMLDSKLYSKNWIYKKLFNLSDDEIKQVKEEVVDDTKHAYRFKEIEEEGNDPAQSAQKINKDGETESSDLFGGKNDSPTDATPNNSGNDNSNVESPSTGEAPISEKVKPEYERPSQKGLKKASNYPFGEDPIGRLARNSTPDRSLYPKGKNNTLLGLESIDFVKLSDFLGDNAEKQLLQESHGTKSMLDESNIIENL